MKSSTSRRYAFALMALAAATSVGCCCTRKGVVLRGDWSLELNRVPHMRSNGPTYDADCAAPSCTSSSGSCSCSDCLSAVGGQEFGSVDGQGTRCLAHRGRMVRDGAGGEYYADDGHGGAHAGGENYVQHDPAAPALSRFHPVPTRPVFEPQNVAYSPEMGAPPQPQVERLPPVDGASRRRTDPTPSTARRATKSVSSSTSTQQPEQYMLVELEQPSGEVRQVAYEEPAAENFTTDPPAAEQAKAAEPSNVPAAHTVGSKNTVTWKVARRRA